ncbi:hypothetical protein [Solimonas terrae]|uniref:Uncharacterized protein n=1 Tax=Solimonas terrae TaxID=1396819 RepID=A0A6M2BQF8_9GAMM|nr:hypothetical protein [Solimonas terrae]NGY04846.1 hypothetical protein [Solimonas terrae]
MSGLLALFFAGVFLVNGVPHFVNGVSGRNFPSPFASPPGRGESTARTNVLWGALNFAIGYGLGWRLAHFDPGQSAQLAALCVGGLLMALAISSHFGKLYGGATAKPKR